jgi:NADH-quinone oxidoreductase subunit M
MEPTGFGIVSLVVFLPLTGALALLFVPSVFPQAIKWIALGTTVATFAASLAMLARFQGGSYHFQLVEFMPWIHGLGVHYRVGIDGVSVWLVLLTALLSVVAVWFSFYVNHRVKTYMAMMLLLETAMLGVFVSLDLILFFTFFEASLIPMYFLIAIWGGERRNYAAIKFFLYTGLASIFALVGIVALHVLMRQQTGVATFDLIAIQDAVASGELWRGAMQAQPLIFWAFAIAFMVKCPMFPFHTWLPDAHTEAPTAGSVILAGVLLKMGTYGFLRFCLPLFPESSQRFVPLMMTLAVIGILYGAIVSAVQPDVKRLVAFSSVAHMGFVMLGVFSLSHTGMMGGSMQQLNHGVTTGALFLLVGLLYERRHTRLFREYGGLKAQMPWFAALFLITTLSSVGLPGLNGFVGEFLALFGAFESGAAGVYGLNIGYAVLAALGVVLAAVYLLWMFHQVFYGPNVNPANRRLKDLKPWEIAMAGALVVLMFWGGLFPNTFLKPTEAALGATRMMAVNPPGMRPSWADLGMEIDDRGDLVAVNEVRRRNEDMEAYTVARVIARGRVHPSDPPIVERATVLHRPGSASPCGGLAWRCMALGRPGLPLLGDAAPSTGMPSQAEPRRAKQSRARPTSPYGATVPPWLDRPGPERELRWQSMADDGSAWHRMALHGSGLPGGATQSHAWPVVGRPSRSGWSSGALEPSWGTVGARTPSSQNRLRP